MFQNNERWYTLVLHVGHRIHEAYDFEGVVEDLQALELLVRTEYQVAELECLIDAAGDSFGCAMEDFLHE